MLKTGVLAVALSVSAYASAQVAVHGMSRERWGVSADALGVGGNTTIEDFEDIDLAPGLQVSWQSPAGDVGPVSALPNTFNPLTDDAFGNAFVGGAWSGTRCLLNTRTNRPFVYSNPANWGDVTLHFNPPARVVGFSLHQMELNATIRVNGVNVTTVNGIANGVSTSSGQVGYIVLKDDTGPGIATVTIVNGGSPSGDGFTLDYLAFSSQRAPRVRASSVNVSAWGASDAILGYADPVVEDFEDVTLVPGLQVEWQSTAGSVGPVSTLPNLFNPLTDDPNGNAFNFTVWDGTRSLISVRNNVSAPYGAVANWGDIIFHFDPPAYRVGFSCGDATLTSARTIVNGRDVGGFITATGLTTGSRNGYARFSALDPEGISTLRIANGRNGFGDGFAVDHLVIAARCAPDLDADGIVDDTDFVLFAQQYDLFACDDPAMPAGCSADFNRDGVVDDVDFVLFAQAYDFFACP